MQSYLVLFRETDAREQAPPAEEQAAHVAEVKKWIEYWSERVKGGRALSMKGIVIGTDKTVVEGPYFIGKEFVGGFLLLEAIDLTEATRIIQTCPILDAGGFAEIREMM